jgi:glycosyltransferase involved in cell wall biosynthesis
MHYYIIIPAHNEEAFIASTLNSILAQSLQPKKVVIVNDNSTDGMEKIVDDFVSDHTIFESLNAVSSTLHMPGSKVIKAFNKGLELLDDQYDFLVKLDADTILPENYFERIAYAFKGNPMVGMAGGFLYEKDENELWKLNHPMDKNHVRGAIKAYSKDCFNAIGGLKNAMGWDTLDELLAQFHGYEIFTDDSLKVKHLRPTRQGYDQKAKMLQGKAMYGMRYGFWISCIASLKMAWKQRNKNVFLDNMLGYFSAKKEKDPFLVTEKEGRFIRKLRWRNIRRKLF